MKRLAVLLVLALLGGCYNKFDDYSPDGEEHVTPNMPIGNIRELYKDKPLIVNKDVVIAGYVTANDREDNFYNSFIIEDASGAIEVMAGINYLHNYYAEGYYVAIRAKDLIVGSSSMNVMQIGLRAAVTTGYEVDYFGHREIIGRYVTSENDINHVVPVEFTIGELDEDMCGRLVRVSGGDGSAGAAPDMGDPKIRCAAIP